MEILALPEVLKMERIILGRNASLVSEGKVEGVLAC